MTFLHQAPSPFMSRLQFSFKPLWCRSPSRLVQPIWNSAAFAHILGAALSWPIAEDRQPSILTCRHANILSSKTHFRYKHGHPVLFRLVFAWSYLWVHEVIVCEVMFFPSGTLSLAFLFSLDSESHFNHESISLSINYPQSVIHHLPSLTRICIARVSCYRILTSQL